MGVKNRISVDKKIQYLQIQYKFVLRSRIIQKMDELT
jgi:hypothetical protein